MENLAQIHAEKRAVLNLIKYEEKYGASQIEETVEMEDTQKHRREFLASFKSKLRKKVSFRPSRSCVTNFVLQRIPVINVVRNYKLSYLLKDIMAGLTVGVIQIAPSMCFYLVMKLS